MFWSCRVLGSFWSNIFRVLYYTPDPFTGIFRTAREGISFPNSQTEAVAFSSLRARRLVFLKWKSTASPSHTHWVRDTMSQLKHERLKYTSLTVYVNHYWDKRVCLQQPGLLSFFLNVLANFFLLMYHSWRCPSFECIHCFQTSYLWYFTSLFLLCYSVFFVVFLCLLWSTL